MVDSNNGRAVLEFLTAYRDHVMEGIETDAEDNKMNICQVPHDQHGIFGDEQMWALYKDADCALSPIKDVLNRSAFHDK